MEMVLVSARSPLPGVCREASPLRSTVWKRLLQTPAGFFPQPRRPCARQRPLGVGGVGDASDEILASFWHQRGARARALKIQPVVQPGEGLLFKKEKKEKRPTANLLIITY